MSIQMKQFFEGLSSLNDNSFFIFLRVYQDPTVLLDKKNNLHFYKQLFLHPFLSLFVDKLLIDMKENLEYPEEALVALKEILEASLNFKMNPTTFLQVHKKHIEGITEKRREFALKARLFNQKEANHVLFEIRIEREIRSLQKNLTPFYEKSECLEIPSLLLKYLYQFHIEREMDEEFVLCTEDRYLICDNHFLKGASKIEENYLDKRYVSILLNLLDISLSMQAGEMKMDYYVPLIGASKIASFQRKNALALYTKLEKILQKADKGKKNYFKVIK